MLKALVTGGTRGIGWAISDRLSRAGLKVTAVGTKPKAKVPTGCSYRACDFSKKFQLETFAQEIATERWDVLVNNAGINKIGRLESYSVDDFESIQYVNVVAPFLLCKAVVPGMKARKFGRILNITSIFGIVSRAERSAYSTSKFGLFGLSRALALEVAADEVLVNCLAPGFVDTDLTRRILKKSGIENVSRQIPMGRLAKPREIAQVAHFLTSKENTYITGQTIVADGGFTSA